MLQPATERNSSHSLSHPNGYRLQEALGYDKQFALKRALEALGVTTADREQAFYPAILGWLADGLEDGTVISAEDVVKGAEELALKKDRNRGHPLNALFGFIRIRAIRRHEKEEADRQADLTARRRQLEGDQQRQLTRLALDAQRQPCPPDWDLWQARAANLADELRSLGRSPRELPLNPAEWPKTYLPIIGTISPAEDQ